MAELSLTMTVLKRQVDEKDRAVLQLKLDDQPLDARIKIMKPFTMYMGSG